MSTCLWPPWTVARQAPLPTGFPRQEYWSGLLFLSPGDLPNPGIEFTSPALAGRFFTIEPPGKPSKTYESENVSRSVLSYATPWTVALQAPLSLGFSRQKYWSGLTFPSPGGLPTPGIKPGSPTLEADSLLSEPPMCYFEQTRREGKKEGRKKGGRKGERDEAGG